MLSEQNSNHRLETTINKPLVWVCLFLYGQSLRWCEITSAIQEQTHPNFYFACSPEEFCEYFFPGLRLPRNEARKILEKFGENSERNSGQNPGRKFEKFGELSFCDFSDLIRWCETTSAIQEQTHPHLYPLKRGCAKELAARFTRLGSSRKEQPCKPISPKFWGWQIHLLNLGGGVSEVPCFTVFFAGAPPKFRG